jgi:hypothetical protein
MTIKGHSSTAILEKRVSYFTGCLKTSVSDSIITWSEHNTLSVYVTGSV